MTKKKGSEVKKITINAEPEGKKIYHTKLSYGGIPVGMLPEFEFTEGTIKLNSTDIVLICSDGITEAQDQAGNMFEESRLIKIVQENFQKGWNGFFGLC